MLLVSIVIVAALLLLLGYSGIYLVRRHAGRGVPVRVAMPEERSANGIALALYRGGVIDRPWLFSWMLTITGTVDRAPTGTISLRDDLTPRAVLRALAAGSGIVRVTIPEGFTRFDIARRLAESGVVIDGNEFIARTAADDVRRRHAILAPSLEGYLYPDSYDLAPGMPADDVIDRMVRTFRRRIVEIRSRSTEGLAALERAGIDEHGWVTLASMIERETGHAADRPRIAAVFLNRLTSPEFPSRLLQSDPTIVYGCRIHRTLACPEPERLTRSAITRAMLDDATNTYNTYRHAGLPPGPIANPGMRSLEAVVSPAASRDLYFVAMGDGRSAFATTLADHDANVRRYLRGRASSAATNDAGRREPSP